MRRPRPVALVLGAAGVAYALMLAGDGMFASLIPRARAQSDVSRRADAPTIAPESGGSPVEEIRATYESLVRELQEQRAKLDARERAQNERERQLGILQRRIDEEFARLETARAAGPRGRGGERDAGFTKLVRAYEAMDPDNAAQAIAALHAKDATAALELLLALPARRTGAILDALAASDARLAALVSREMAAPESSITD